jgi:hypothetical protein
MKNYYDLCSAIVYDYYDTVNYILSRDKNIDLRYKNGNLFIQAVEGNRVEILKLLIEYYQNNQLDKQIKSSSEYNVLKSNLINILQTAIEDVMLSPEMKEVLSPYINFEGSEHNTLNDSFLNLEDLLVFNYDESHPQPEEDHTTNVALSGNNIQEVH